MLTSFLKATIGVGERGPKGVLLTEVSSGTSSGPPRAGASRTYTWGAGGSGQPRPLPQTSARGGVRLGVGCGLWLGPLFLATRAPYCALA